MSFSKILHGIQSGNDGDQNFVCQGKTPLFFRASGQGTSRDAGESAGSRDCFTGDTVCRFHMKKTGQSYIFHLKIS